jgi:hypothetical protein
MKRIQVLMIVGLITMVAGCPFFQPDNPAAILEGTWQVTFDEPGDLVGYDIQATFDSDGQLVNITAEAPLGGTASLDVDSATTTEVDGVNVTITIPVAAGTRVLEGTLSEDNNTITGSLSSELELPSGDLDVTLPGSDLTLERLE